MNSNIVRVRRFIHHILAVLAALAVVASSGRARAVPAITVQPLVTRKVVSHSDQTTYNWISRSDCLLDDVLGFTLAITDPQGSQVEAWVGEGSTDCTVKTNRTGATLSCLRVYTGLATPTPQTVGIRARNIAAVESGIFGEGGPEPPASYCDKTSGGTAADQVTVYFMLIQSTDQVASAPWQTKIDLLGPNPPAKIGLGVGSTLLKANWDLNSDPDVAGYEFFCDPPPGGTPSDAAPMSAATGGSCADAATAGSVDASSSDASGGGAFDGGAASDVSPSDALDDGSDSPVTLAVVAADEGGVCVASDASSARNCGGFNFVPGVAPSLDVINGYQCGSVSGNTSTSMILKGFANGVPVAVAVAAIDAVQNVGPLSAVACATPDLVNGFDELYHQAGGTAGGGFCALSHLPANRGGGGGALFFVLGWVVAAWRRQRVLRRNDNTF